MLQHREALQLDGSHAGLLKLFIAKASKVRNVLDADVGGDQALKHSCRELVGGKPLLQLDKMLILDAAGGRLSFSYGDRAARGNGYGLSVRLLVGIEGEMALQAAGEAGLAQVVVVELQAPERCYKVLQTCAHQDGAAVCVLEAGAKERKLAAAIAGGSGVDGASLRCRFGFSGD